MFVAFLSGPNPSDVFLVLGAFYLSAVLLKQAARRGGEPRAVFAATALFLLPLIIVTYFVYGGAVLGVFSNALEANRDARNWWIVVIAGEGEREVTVNLLEAGIIIAVLYIVSTVLIWAASTLYFRRKKAAWLAIHKALLKWPVVIIGCLICLKIDLWAILLGTSVAVIGIGLILKETIENLFTGIALEMEGTLRRGDWIQLGEGPETAGRVYDKTWRATKVETINDESITIPNRLLSAEKIKNYNRPMGPHARNITVGASYGDPPVKVKEVLRTILMREPEVLERPAPLVRTAGYEDFSISYEMKFWIRDYGRHKYIEDKILTQVWYAFKFYGIRIPFPIRTVHTKGPKRLAEEEERVEEIVGEKIRFLEGLDHFASLSRREFEFLARNSFWRLYAPGEHVVVGGESGDALYIVMSGWCEAILPRGQRPRLEPGHFFGEMGLLTGGKRTVDVLAGGDGARVLRLDKECMVALFRAHPGLRAAFHEVREARHRELSIEEKAAAPRKRSLAGTLARGVLDFLRPW